MGVSSTTGLVYIVNQLDYERHGRYELVVRATDSVSGVYAEVPVHVDVDDANDWPPEFVADEYNVTVSEAAPPGAVLLTVRAHDQDSGTIFLVGYENEVVVNWFLFIRSPSFPKAPTPRCATGWRPAAALTPTPASSSRWAPRTAS